MEKRFSHLKYEFLMFHQFVPHRNYHYQNHYFLERFFKNYHLDYFVARSCHFQQTSCILDSLSKNEWYLCEIAVTPVTIDKYLCWVFTVSIFASQKLTFLPWKTPQKLQLFPRQVLQKLPPQLFFGLLSPFSAEILDLSRSHSLSINNLKPERLFFKNDCVKYII